LKKTSILLQKVIVCSHISVEPEAVEMSQFKVLKQSVALISLSRPPVNGLSVDVRRSVLNGVDRAVKENLKAIVLTGDGSMFSGGSDIKEIARGAYFKSPTLTELTNALDSCNIPVIAGKRFNHSCSVDITIFYHIYICLCCPLSQECMAMRSEEQWK